MEYIKNLELVESIRWVGKERLGQLKRFLAGGTCQEGNVFKNEKGNVCVCTRERKRYMLHGNIKS